MKVGYPLILVLGLALAGCAGHKKVTLTPLEIQALQQRDFEADKAIVFASIVSVFQDLGYIIEGANLETGFITAVSATKDTTSGINKLWLGAKQQSDTKATAFVEGQGGNLTHVRLNFVVKNMESSWYGRETREDTPIVDAQVYQNAFERIEEAIFIRSGSKSKSPES